MLQKIKFAIIALVFGASAFANDHIDVAAIVWPAYQPEPRWKELGIFEHGNGEWQNVYEATPKFKGHNEPRVPYWGYENEADPKVVARKIDAALAAGVNIFIYDWYWYQGRPFLENALNEGFLKAPNNERMKFYIMYANHDVDNLWNNKIAKKEMDKPHYNADVTPEEFKKLAHRWVNMYFKKPNYYKIDGKPVFWLYLPNGLIRAMGAKKTKECLEYLDKITKEAGFKGIHLQFHCGTAGWPPIVPIEGNKNPTPAEYFKYFNVDSCAAYNWMDINFVKGKDVDYDEWGTKCMNDAEMVQNMYQTPYCANVTVAWDNNSRFPSHIRNNVSLNANPKSFEKYLRQAKEWAIKNPTKDGAKLVIINAWNEWTEGGYIEPDTQHGYGYLNACAHVFGSKTQRIEDEKIAKISPKTKKVKKILKHKR